MKRKMRKQILAVALTVSLTVVAFWPIPVQAMKIQHPVSALNAHGVLNTQTQGFRKSQEFQVGSGSGGRQGDLREQLQTMFKEEQLQATPTEEQLQDFENETSRLPEINGLIMQLNNRPKTNVLPGKLGNRPDVNLVTQGAAELQDAANTESDVVKYIPSEDKNNNLIVYVDCYVVIIGEYILVNSLRMDGIVMAINGEEHKLDYGEIVFIKGKDTLKQLVLPSGSRVLDLSEELDTQGFEELIDRAGELDAQSFEELAYLLLLLDVEVLESILEGNGYAPGDERASELLEEYVKNGVCTTEQAWQTFTERLAEIERERQEEISRNNQTRTDSDKPEIPKPLPNTTPTPDISGEATPAPTPTS